MTSDALPLLSIVNKPRYALRARDQVAAGINETTIWSYQKPGNERSTKKTHYLHEAVRKIVEAGLGTAESALYEKAIFASEQFGTRGGGVKRMGDVFPKALGKAYQSDLFIDSVEAPGKNAFVFGAKYFMTSIAKNETNYINGFMGEITQFFGAPENANNNLVLFNIRPRRTFMKTGSGAKTKLSVQNVNYTPFADKSGRLHKDYQNSLSTRAYRQTRVVNIDFDWAQDLNIDSVTSLPKFAAALEVHPTYGIDYDSIQMHGLKELIADIIRKFDL